MRVTFLAPRLPPSVCGVGDHTMQLARAMSEQGVEASFIHREPRSMPADLPCDRVDVWTGGSASLVECLQRQCPDWLWVQLSGYGYSRWGAPYRLGCSLARTRRELPRVRVAVCAHETHCQTNQLGAKGRLLSPWQRLTVGRITRLADVCFTSIPTYVRQIVDTYRVESARVVSLPIGSSIPASSCEFEHRARTRRSLGWGTDEVIAVTFGSYGTQMRALRQCGRQLASAVKSGALDRVVCIGGNTATVPSEFEVWSRTLGRAGVLAVLGHRSERCVADVLACCDVAFSGYPEWRIGKSSACSAFALAGLPVLVADSDGTIGKDECSPLMVLNDSSGWPLDRSVHTSAAKQMRQQAAAAHYSWRSIARRALDAMQTHGRVLHGGIVGEFTK